jgi:hypothetical protein
VYLYNNLKKLCRPISYCSQAAASWNPTVKTSNSNSPLASMPGKRSRKTRSEHLLRTFLKAWKAHAKRLRRQILCEKWNLRGGGLPCAESSSSGESSASVTLRLSTSPGYLWLTTGIPVGKPAGMETHGSELLVITGLYRSGCLFCVLQVLATSTCKTKIFWFPVSFY